MDFGKVPVARLNEVNFTLPPEPIENATVLPGKRVANPKVYVGCPRWGVKEWVGRLYPKGTKDAAFLEEYVKAFNCIELNSTFYNLYDNAAIARWSAKAGDREFKFCPKVFQGISHEGNLTEKLPLMQAFAKSISAFGPHRGPAFLQMSDGFGPQRKDELSYLLNGLPLAFDLFVELRHPGWFAKDELDELVALLQSANKGLVITDTAGRRDVCPMRLAVPKAMVRFVGNNLHPTDYRRIDDWVQRIAHWLERGLEELCFFVHMQEEQHSPEAVSYLIDKLNEVCELALKKPMMPQGLLF